jgi:tetraacyldisaccharide 4'-kinase
MRFLLRLAEAPYTLAVNWRNRRFDLGAAKVYHPDVPVVSVGNITTGGTGKTPMVEWLARWFRQRGIRVALISRGYGAERGSRNDEALELEQRLPDVPHLQNPDRVEAARIAVQELECQLIILDDAFQHRRIARDLDLVLVDAITPFGYGHVLPRGMLREPLKGLGRADVVGLSRSDCASQERVEWIRQQVRRYAPDADWIELAHVPTRLHGANEQTAPVDSLDAQPVAAFCGIGNPDGFRHTLAQCGFTVAGLRDYPDHHAYSRGDVESLDQWVRSLPDAKAVICSHKDLVKIGLPRLGARPLWAVVIRLDVRRGLEPLERRLQAVANRA